MTFTPKKPDEMRKLAEAATQGEWSVPHFARPEVNCNCEYVLSDHLMGAIATVHCSGDGDDWIKSGDNPRYPEAVANALLISACNPAQIIHDADLILSLTKEVEGLHALLRRIMPWVHPISSWSDADIEAANNLRADIDRALSTSGRAEP